MATHSYKCPNCGAPLVYQPGEEKSACEFCSSSYTIEELEAFMAEEERNEASEQREKVQENEQEISEEVMGYHCESCGAEVVTDNTTTATFCYYCHNPVLITSRLKGDFKPDIILPFKINKDKAQETFLNWAKSKKYVPSSFYSSSQLEKITGIYLPYWMANVDTSFDVKGTGERTRVWTSGDTEYTETKSYTLHRSGDLSINNVGELAFTKIDKGMIDSITPYNESECKDFSMPYLTGFFAESYDIQKEDLEDNIRNRIKTYANNLLVNSAENYDYVSFDSASIDNDITKWNYALLPAWILTYHYLGKTYVYAINGQTGEAFGELPLDQKKLAISSGIIGFVILAILILGGLLIW